MALKLLEANYPRASFGMDDELYPEQLLITQNPPERLYVYGNPHALKQGLAIVGARKATPYGENLAFKLAAIAAEIGIAIISGGAKGCDTASHRGALSKGGVTVSVLGGGPDVVYPASSEATFLEILASGGALISEHPFGCPPMGYAFRERNRIIAGLASAVLVVEAALPSGTFTTADFALDAGREVLAVPGSVYSPTSRGANRLIAQGAHAVVDEQSYSELLGHIFGLQYLPKGSNYNDTGFGYKTQVAASKDSLLAALIAQPMRSEQIVSAFNLTAREVAIKLSDYEALGLITRYSNGTYGPIAHCS